MHVLFGLVFPLLALRHPHPASVVLCCSNQENNSAADIEVDLRMMRLEDLMGRKAMLNNSVLLRQNPHDVQVRACVQPLCVCALLCFVKALLRCGLHLPHFPSSPLV